MQDVRVITCVIRRILLRESVLLQLRQHLADLFLVQQMPNVLRKVQGHAISLQHQCSALVAHLRVRHRLAEVVVVYLAEQMPNVQPWAQELATFLPCSALVAQVEVQLRLRLAEMVVGVYLVLRTPSVPHKALDCATCRLCSVLVALVETETVAAQQRPPLRGLIILVVTILCITLIAVNSHLVERI